MYLFNGIFPIIYAHLFVFDVQFTCRLTSLPPQVSSCLNLFLWPVLLFLWTDTMALISPTFEFWKAILKNKINKTYTAVCNCSETHEINLGVSKKKQQKKKWRVTVKICVKNRTAAIANTDPHAGNKVWVNFNEGNCVTHIIATVGDFSKSKSLSSLGNFSSVQQEVKTKNTHRLAQEAQEGNQPNYTSSSAETTR